MCYCVAAATNGQVLATTEQLDAIVVVCTVVMRHHRWVSPSVADVRARILGHDERAIWTPAYTRDRSRWGKLERKVDPTGQRADGRKVIDVDAVARLEWE